MIVSLEFLILVGDLFRVGIEKWSGKVLVLQFSFSFQVGIMNVFTMGLGRWRGQRRHMIRFLQVFDLVMFGIRNDQIPNRIVRIRDRCRCVIHWAVDRLRNSWCRLIHRLYYCRCRCIHRFDSFVGRLSNDRFYRGVGRLSHHRCGHWVDNGCFGAAGVAFIGRCRCVGLSCVLDGFALIKNFSLKRRSLIWRKIGLVRVKMIGLLDIRYMGPRNMSPFAPVHPVTVRDRIPWFRRFRFSRGRGLHGVQSHYRHPGRSRRKSIHRHLQCDCRCSFLPAN